MSVPTILLAVAAIAVGIIILRSRGSSASMPEPVRIEVHTDEEPLSRSR